MLSIASRSNAYVHRFFYENYTEGRLQKSFGITAQHPILNKLDFKDPTCEGCQVGKNDGLVYGQVLSAVIFLTQNDAPLTGFTRDRLIRDFGTQNVERLFGKSGETEK